MLACVRAGRPKTLPGRWTRQLWKHDKHPEGKQIKEKKNHSFIHKTEQKRQKKDVWTSINFVSSSFQNMVSWLMPQTLSIGCDAAGQQQVAVICCRSVSISLLFLSLITLLCDGCNFPQDVLAVRRPSAWQTVSPHASDTCVNPLHRHPPQGFLGGGA